jgi:hypothetical protein
MSGGDPTSFKEVIALIDKYYEYGLIEFQNGDIVNGSRRNNIGFNETSFVAFCRFTFSGIA